MKSLFFVGWSLFFILMLIVFQSCSVVEEPVHKDNLKVENPSDASEKSEENNPPLLLYFMKEDPTYKQKIEYSHGVEAYKNGDYAQAVKWFQEAAQQGEVSAYFILGMMYLNYDSKGIHKNHGKAIKWLRKAVQHGHVQARTALEQLIQQSKSKLLNEADFANERAAQYNQQGLFQQALSLLEKSYLLRAEILGKKHPETLISLNNLGHTYEKLGHYSEALPLLEKSYLLRTEVFGEKHPKTLTSLNNLANIYHSLGRLSEALPLYEKAVRLKKEILGEKHPDTILSINNLAIIYSDLGYLSKALLLYEKSYHFFKEMLGENHLDTLTSLNNLALHYQNLGRLSEALPLLEKGYRLSSKELGEKHPLTLTSLHNLANIYNELERFSQALSLFEKCYMLDKMVFGEKHPKTLSNLRDLVDAYAKQGQMNEATKHLEKLVEGVESLRSGDLSAENRQLLFKKWVKKYFLLSFRYIHRYRFKDAFRLAEMSKARTLLESLAAKLAGQQSGLTTTEQQQLQYFDARIALLNNSIAKTLEDNRLEEKIGLESEKNQLVIELAKFERELKAKYHKYAQLSKVQIIGTKEGAKYLPADAVLISYLVNGNNLLAFTLEPNGKLNAHDLKEIPDLEKDLDDYRRGLAPNQDSRRDQNQVHRFGSSKRKQETQAIGIKLGKRLLEPLKKIIKDKPHWIISPSGPLALIPFETLRFEGQKQPVIAQHQISYVQSLSILALLQKRGEAYKTLQNRGSLLAMGAPIYEMDDKVIDINNPSATDFKIARQMVKRGGDYSHALRQLNLKWKNLPGTLKELKQLEKLFKGQKPRIYKEADATEMMLQNLSKQGVLAKYRYLVFSAHGYLSDEVPTLSSIVLGQINNPPSIDGYVTAGEWPGYNLKSDLMVLSACETGLGEVVGGEGVMGLPYALYVAGNKNTILTLWSISDKVTAEFITSFFRKLKAGRGQVEALTATKREFINKGGKYANPKYWAAFVLYGV